MALPFSPPLDPMLAKLIPAIPEGKALLFEPKWDGFRALVFRDGEEGMIQSRDKKGLDRYFPELAEPLRGQLPERCVIDGEIVLYQGSRLEFDVLQQRIHPAKSRVDRLAAETPAAFVAFDLLALGDEDLRGRPMAERRRLLEETLEGAEAPIFLTPMTEDPDVAKTWFRDFEGAGLDGLIAKAPDLTYQPKKRAMFKIKHQRTADCVVAGFRWHKNGPGELVGSLLLGLYDETGELQHVGITASFKVAERKRLAEELAPLREGARDAHPWQAWAEEEAHADQRLPGAVSRWSGKKNLSWNPLRLERVCEVKYDFLQGNRFRHATTFVRWRHDKQPSDCTYEQLDEPAPYDIRHVLERSTSRT